MVFQRQLKTRYALSYALGILIRGSFWEHLSIINVNLFIRLERSFDMLYSYIGTSQLDELARSNRAYYTMRDVTTNDIGEWLNSCSAVLASSGVSMNLFTLPKIRSTGHKGGPYTVVWMFRSGAKVNEQTVHEILSLLSQMCPETQACNIDKLCPGSSSLNIKCEYKNFETGKFEHGLMQLDYDGAYFTGVKTLITLNGKRKCISNVEVYTSNIPEVVAVGAREPFNRKLSLIEIAFTAPNSRADRGEARYAVIPTETSVRLCKIGRGKKKKNS